MNTPLFKGKRHLTDCLLLASITAPYISQAHIQSSLELTKLKTQFSKLKVTEELLRIKNSEAVNLPPETAKLRSEAVELHSQIIMKQAAQIDMNMAALDLAWQLVQDADVFIAHKKRRSITQANKDVSPSVEFQRVLFNAEELHKKGEIPNSKDLRTFKVWLFRAMELIHPEVDRKQFWKRVLNNDRCIDNVTLAMLKTLRTETKKNMTNKLNAKKQKSGSLPK